MNLEIQGEEDEFQLNLNLGYSLKDNQEFYQLPQLIQYSSKLSNEVEHNLHNLPEDMRIQAIEVFKSIQEHLKVWDVPIVPLDNENRVHLFKLPPTAFKGYCQIFPNHIKNKEYFDVQTLSSSQISQIFNEGIFEMPSRYYQVPYIWQLSNYIVKGRKNITQSYIEDIGTAYTCIKDIPIYLYSDRDFQGNACTLRSGIYKILFVIHFQIQNLSFFFSILIGFRETFQAYNDAELKNFSKNKAEIARQLSLQKNEKLNRNLYEYLKFTNMNSEFLVSTQRISQILEKQNNLNEKLIGVEAYMHQEYCSLLLKSESNDPEELKEYFTLAANLEVEDDMKFPITIDKDIDEQIEEAKIKAQKQFLMHQFPKMKSIIEHIASLIECKRCYRYYDEMKKIEFFERMKNFEIELPKKHPIKSQSRRFCQLEKKVFQKKCKNELREKYQYLVVEDLKSKNIEDSEILISYYQMKTQLKKSVSELFKASTIKDKNPNIIITCTRKCLPPYKIIRFENHYSLERDTIYTITSSCFCWRLQLILVRYFCFTVNIMLWLIENAFSGTLGVRALFSCSIFYPKVEIDFSTGIISSSMSYSITPVFVQLSNVLQKIKASREAFENLPDTGFFGKDFSIICHYINIYFYQFFLVGIIGVLITLPLLILINFTTSIILAISAWIWSPIILILMFIMQLLFFDFDCSQRKMITIMSSPLRFPLFTAIYKILFEGICYIFLNIVIVTIVIPLFCLCTLIFAHIRYCLRSLYDCLMILFVICFGRSPATENSLAWIIFEPSGSEGYFIIKNEEVIILVAAELERCILREYHRRLSELIQIPRQIKKTFATLFQIENYNDGCNVLQNCLETQISERISQLPTLHNQIRFNKVELQIVEMQIKQFLKCQIKLKCMDNFIWNSYNIQQGDFTQLTAQLLIRIFGYSIMEPLQGNHKRFQLVKLWNIIKPLEEKNHIAIVQEQVQEQVCMDEAENYRKIERNKKNTQATIKRYISFADVQLQSIQIVQEVWQCQSLTQNWSSISHKHLRFYLNYCLQEQY